MIVLSIIKYSSFKNGYKKDHHSLEVGCVILFLRGQEEHKLVLCFPRIYKGDESDSSSQGKVGRATCHLHQGVSGMGWYGRAIRLSLRKTWGNTRVFILHSCLYLTPVYSWLWKRLEWNLEKSVVLNFGCGIMCKLLLVSDSLLDQMFPSQPRQFL